jgi:hypothetical protein
MKINIENFRNVITKATLNFGIETLQLRFSDRIKCDSINQNGTSISILDVENDVLDTNEQLTFNFGDPSNNVIPYINLLKKTEPELSLTDLFMKFIDDNHSYKVGFVSDAAIKKLGTDDVKNVDWFFETEIDQQMIDNFEPIKKIGSRFGKVYIDLDTKRLFINTTDKTNRYSNDVKFKIADLDMDDLSLAYTYTDMVNFFHCIEMNIDKKFTMKVSFDQEQGLGCLYAHSEAGDEKYALISRENL